LLELSAVIDRRYSGNVREAAFLVAYSVFAAIPLKSLLAIALLAAYFFVLMSHGEGWFREVLHRESVRMPQAGAGQPP